MLRTLVLTAALVPVGAGATRLAFAPEPELQLSKRFQVSIFHELDDLSILVGGTDMGDMIGDFELSLGVDTTVQVVDTYASVADGRPTDLERLYDEILLEARFDYISELDSGEESQTAESDLEGETVLFRWDEDAEEYVLEYETGEGDELLLDGLIEDMDLRALLPAEEVEVDDEWEVDPEALGPILAPGGALGLFQQDLDEEAMELLETLSGANLEELVDSLFAGDVVCTYAGTREVDERELAIVEVRIDIDSSTDLRQYILDYLDTLAEGPPSDFDLSEADLRLLVEGTARLEWDVAGGHFRHFEAYADTGVTFHLVASGEGESGDVTVELSGDVEVLADVVER